MVFETLNLRQQRTAVPERQETNEVSPTTAIAHCLDKTAVLGARKRTNTAVTTQHHERGLNHVPLASEKIQIQNSKV